MTLEEQYQQETGDSPIYDEVHIYGAATGEYTRDFVKWLEQKASLHALAVARFRAGEEFAADFMESIITMNVVPMIEGMNQFHKWRAAIAAYEAAVKGEGE